MLSLERYSVRSRRPLLFCQRQIDMLTQPILHSFTALVFFFYGGLGFPNLPPVTPTQPASLLRKAPSPLAPEKIGNRILELTQRLDFVSPSEMTRNLSQNLIIYYDPKQQLNGNHLSGRQLMDIAPTVFHLLGQPMPDDMQGKIISV